MTDPTTADARTQYWQEQVTAWQASGQSQLAFCKANSLNYPRFGYWLRKFRQQNPAMGSARRSSGFVPVVAASDGEALSLHLPNGIVLRGLSEQNLPLLKPLLAQL